MTQAGGPAAQVRRFAKALLAAWCLLSVPCAEAHSPPSYSPVPPLRVDKASLYDAKDRPFVFWGVEMRGLEVFTPNDASREQLSAMSSLTFRVLRQRWNVNSVRLPVSPWIWRRDGQAYLNQVAEIVKRANTESLWVVLVAVDDANSGSQINVGLPGAAVDEFWTACATSFKSTPMLIFDLYGRPSAQFVPGASTTSRRGADWTFWRDGGTASSGTSVIGMQTLVNHIRAAGAMQLIAATAFHDKFDFQGFDAFLNDPNILYEVHPFFDHALTDTQRYDNFGFLAGRVPVYAGEWGTPLLDDSASCRSVPSDPRDAVTAVGALLGYMSAQGISWTASSFTPGSLVRDFASGETTEFDGTWTCGVAGSPQRGMGGTLLYWLTGDFYGFGTLLRELIVNAAANQAGPIAPGEVLAVYGQGIGPDTDVAGSVNNGKLGTDAGEAKVLFDGIPGAIFSAGSFQVTVQVPYEVEGRTSVTVQGVYRDVPSNKVVMPVSPVSPALFTVSGFQDVLAQNATGFRNSSTLPATPGSIVTMYASGFGRLNPPRGTGQVATAPLSISAAPVSMKIAGLDAEILYAGEAPGMVGAMQINVRLPELAALDTTRAVPVSLRVGDAETTGFRIWVR